MDMRDFIKELNAINNLADRYNCFTFLACIDPKHIKTFHSGEFMYYQFPRDIDVLLDAFDKYNLAYNYEIDMDGKITIINHILKAFDDILIGGNEDTENVIFIPTSVEKRIIDEVHAAPRLRAEMFGEDDEEDCNGEPIIDPFEDTK